MNFRILLTAIAAATTVVAAVAAPASSRLAEGRWIKVKVTSEGIQQISHRQLRQWGFDDPARVGVYGFGGTSLAHERISAGSDDLCPTPVIHTPDGRMLFYGDADLRYDLRGFDATDNHEKERTLAWRRNIYDDGGYYFIGEAEASPSCNIPAAAPAMTSSIVYTGHIHVDATDIDLTSPLSMGAVYCERSFTAADPYRITFATRDRVASEILGGTTRPTQIGYQLLVANEAAILPGALTLHRIEGPAAAFVSKQTTAHMTGYTVEEYARLYGSVDFSSNDADISGTLEISRPAATAGHTYYMDRHALVYPRLNRLADGDAQLLMQYPVSQAGATIRISDARPSLRLWDVSNPAGVSLLSLDFEGTCATTAMPASFSPASPGRLLLFDEDAAHYEPEFAGEVSLQNIHAAPVPDMAIITTAACEPYARMLAEAHERVDGIKVGVFLSGQVYNEFSSGGCNPTAYRRLARMFHDRDPLKFRYLLLMGSSDWDHRGITTTRSDEKLAIHECNVPLARLSRNSCYASDAFAGCLDDIAFENGHRAKMTVAVGRITARTPSEAGMMVQRTIDYIETPPPAAAHTRTLMVSATGDKYEHFEYCEDMTAEIERTDGGFVISRLPMIAYPSTAGSFKEAHLRLKDHLGEGRGLLAFFGHSAQGNTLGSGFYSCAIADILDYDVPPIALLATCNAFAIDRDIPTLAPTMVAKRGGGAIGVIAASRSVFSDHNRTFACQLAKAYVTARPGHTLGDIYRTAHNSVVSMTSSALCFNSKCFNLCGDPAVRIPIAGARAVLDAAGSDGATHAAQGLSSVTFRGHIENPDGTPDDTFSGTAEIIVYDTPVQGSVQVADPAAPAPEIIIRNTRIATATVPVSDGKWEASVFIPEFSSPGSDYAVSIDATSPSGAAHGYRSDLPSASEAASTEGLDPAPPAITEMYVDSPDFTEGGETGPDIIVAARISVPPTGVNINTAPLAGPTRIILDGSDTRSNISGYMTVDPADGSLLLSMPYSGLAEGRHSVTLSAANNLGAATQRTIGFTVRAAAGHASIAVEERPARTSATFSVEHDLGDGTEGLLIIEDHTGSTVRSQSSLAGWDLTDNEGRPVASGVYRAYALLRNGLRRAATGAVEVIVLRNK